MKLHELSPAEGSKKAVKRIGRGAGSGQGKTAGKGHKGAKARSATAAARVSKAVRCRFRDVCLREASTTFSELSMQ